MTLNHHRSRWLLSLLLAFFLGCCLAQDNTSSNNNETLSSSSSSTNRTDDDDDVVVLGEDDYCPRLRPGDILVFLVESNGPRGVLIGFLALTRLPAGLTLYLTNRSWNGERFLDDNNHTHDGEVTVTIGDGQDIDAASRFGYGESTFELEWEGGPLTLNTETGDTLILYCIDSSSTSTGSSVVNPILGFNNADRWAEENTTEFTESDSILPSPLTEVGSVVLPHWDNYEYIGPNEGNKGQLQQFMSDPNNWNGTDSSFLNVVEEQVVLENTTETTIVANPGALEGIIPVTAPPAGGPMTGSMGSTSSSNAAPRILSSSTTTITTMGWVAASSIYYWLMMDW